jgi:hypothetical protein
MARAKTTIGLAVILLAVGLTGALGPGVPGAVIAPVAGVTAHGSGIASLVGADDAGLRPHVRPPAQVAQAAARLMADLAAIKTPLPTIEAEAAALLAPTGCHANTRVMVIPRGFSDPAAVSDRISLEGRYYGADIIEVAEASIPPNAGIAPQFKGLIAVVFLSDCPA